MLGSGLSRRSRLLLVLCRFAPVGPHALGTLPQPTPPSAAAARAERRPPWPAPRRCRRTSRRGTRTGPLHDRRGTKLAGVPLRMCPRKLDGNQLHFTIKIQLPEIAPSLLEMTDSGIQIPEGPQNPAFEPRQSNSRLAIVESPVKVPRRNERLQAFGRAAHGSQGICKIMTGI